jgi:hypothetical protein
MAERGLAQPNEGEQIRGIQEKLLRDDTISYEIAAKLINLADQPKDTDQPRLTADEIRKLHDILNRPNNGQIKLSTSDRHTLERVVTQESRRIVLSKPEQFRQLARPERVNHSRWDPRVVLAGLAIVGLLPIGGYVANDIIKYNQEKVQLVNSIYPINAQNVQKIDDISVSRRKLEEEFVIQNKGRFAINLLGSMGVVAGILFSGSFIFDTLNKYIQNGPSQPGPESVMEEPTPSKRVRRRRE